MHWLYIEVQAVRTDNKGQSDWYFKIALYTGGLTSDIAKKGDIIQLYKLSYSRPILHKMVNNRLNLQSQ